MDKMVILSTFVHSCPQFAICYRCFMPQVKIPTGNVFIQGTLEIPQNAKGIVLFAHGSGSSRFSPRNQFVAKYLQEANLATLLLDLLTPEEEKIDNNTREFRFDIDKLAQRLINATDWLTVEDNTKSLSIGYFGSSTGAAAALIAASQRIELVNAVVSRGGRVDLAAQYLSLVNAASLFLVGGEDHQVLELNRQAFDLLRCEKKLQIIPNATHLFEEPGKLQEVSKYARDWFVDHLSIK